MSRITGKIVNIKHGFISVNNGRKRAYISDDIWYKTFLQWKTTDSVRVTLFKDSRIKVKD